MHARIHTYIHDPVCSLSQKSGTDAVPGSNWRKLLEEKRVQVSPLPKSPVLELSFYLLGGWMVGKLKALLRDFWVLSLLVVPREPCGTKDQTQPGLP